jgi:hypothetical protein
MALHSSLPIYRDVYALTVLVANLVSNIPRKHKRRGDKLDDECSELMVLVFRANVARNKVPYLSELVERVESLNFMFRLCCDLKIISERQYAQGVALLGGIGRQANGWKKSASASPAA